MKTCLIYVRYINITQSISYVCVCQYQSFHTFVVRDCFTADRSDNSCIISANHIAGHCISVNSKCQGLLCLQVLYCGVIYEWLMWVEDGWRKTRCRHRSTLIEKHQRGRPHLTDKSSQQMNCWGIWNLIQVYFGAESSDWGSVPPTLPILGRK